MKFSDAFEKAFQLEKQADPSFKGVKEDYLRAAALVWNMVAAADGQLDDFVIVDKNNFPVSFPRPKDVEFVQEPMPKKRMAKTDDVSVEKTAKE